MAQFSYESYAAQQQARNASGSSNAGARGNGRPEVHFLGEYLERDGDVAVVRFPYTSMADINFETTHSVTFPGKSYPSRVRCTGDNCPFCAQGVKLDTRFFAKLLVYIVGEDGAIQIKNIVWDRPSAFADIDIKNLIKEYGDISQQLFKIKRNGIGTATRYTISIIINATVYNPAVYKADFTELNTVDPSRILSKSLAQYNQAINPAASAPADAVAANVSNSQQVTPAAAPAAMPVGDAAATPVSSETNTDAGTNTGTVETRRQIRYQF